MNKPILYCAAVLRYLQNQWIGDFEYFHAESQGDARLKYTRSNSNDIIRGRLRITSIAPVVGYFQDATEQIYV